MNYTIKPYTFQYKQNPPSKADFVCAWGQNDNSLFMLFIVNLKENQIPNNTQKNNRNYKRDYVRKKAYYCKNDYC